MKKKPKIEVDVKNKEVLVIIYDIDDLIKIIKECEMINIKVSFILNKDNLQVKAKRTP